MWSNNSYNVTCLTHTYCPFQQLTVYACVWGGGGTINSGNITRSRSLTSTTKNTVRVFVLTFTRNNLCCLPPCYLHIIIIIHVLDTFNSILITKTLTWQCVLLYCPHWRFRWWTRSRGFSYSSYFLSNQSRRF